MSHAAHAEHHPFQAHHFDDMDQQFDAGKLGMWLFLATEVLFFSGMFVAYSVYRINHPEVFVNAHQYLDKWLGAFNTIVLLASSLSVAWGVRCAQLDNRKGLLGCLLFTLACAGLFMGVKAVEYTLKFHEGIFWASKYAPPAPGSHPDLTDAYGQLTTLTIIAGVVGAIFCGLGIVSGLGLKFRGWALLAIGLTFLSVAGGIAGARGIQVYSTAANAHGHGDHATTDHATTEHAATDHAATEAHAADEHAALAEGATAEHAAEAVADPATAAAATDEMAATDEPVIPAAAAVDPSKINLAKPDSNVEQRLEGVFFSIYYAMTGVHALHIFGGIVVITWLVGRAGLNHFNHTYFGPVEYVGLYWHLVDLIWIFLFPLLYLIH